MKFKKITAIICAAALILSLAACAKKADYSGTTVVGKVTAADGNKVTVSIGTLDESAENTAKPDSDGQTPPEKPDGDSNSDGQTPPTKPDSDGNSDGQTPPEKPDSDGNSDGQTPPEKPDGNGNSDGQTPPTKPDGDSNSDSQTPPEKPGGDSNNGSTPPDMPDGNSATFTESGDTAEIDLSSATVTENGNTVSVSDIEVGDILRITFNDKNTAETVEIVSVSANAGGNGGQSGTVTQGDSATTISEDGTYSSASYSSTGDDENALRIDGATVTLDGISVDKSAGSSSNTENGDFYGVNAAVLATNGASVTIKNATVTSSAQNGNGIFSYGSKTTVAVSDSTVTTTADNSGGIQTTGGGTTIASNLTVTTSGNSSAAIRSDRGGGTVKVDGGTYTSKGYNSPAVYSTADITVKNATLTAENSEALVIEGQNSITLENCNVSGNMSDTKGTSSDENVHNVMIYQSMSGDADVGTSSFSMTGGSLLSNNGDMFYVTNTDCNIYLSGVTLINKDSDAYLMNICGNSASHGWGTAGKNGANVTFTADGQTLEGNISVDAISTLNMTLKNGSTFTGTVNIRDNAEGGTAVSDNAVITVDEGSVWNLTGDCTVTSVTNNGTINFNGYTITLADGTVLK